MLLSVSLCQHAVAITPAGPQSLVARASCLLGEEAMHSVAAAFPVIQAGRLPHYPFRGLLDVHFFFRITACVARGIAKAILSIEGSDGFVTSTAAPIASGWNDKLPGRACTYWENQYFPWRTE